MQSMSSRPEYQGHEPPDPSQKLPRRKPSKRNSHLLGQGHSSLSISSIESNQNTVTQKPHMESIKKYDNERGITSIDDEWDEKGFVLSTQEGQMNMQSARVVMDDEISPRVNKIRGITP